MRAEGEFFDRGEIAITLRDGLCARIVIAGGTRFVSIEGKRGFTDTERIDTRRITDDGTKIVLSPPTTIDGEPIVDRDGKPVKNYFIHVTIEIPQPYTVMQLTEAERITQFVEDFFKGQMG